MGRIECSYTDLVDLNELKPHPSNRNKHSDKQIKALAKIIARNGQRSPIVVSNQSGYMVKGHGRLEAIKLLGWDTCAVDYQNYSDEVEELRDRIADNEIAKYSEFDEAGFIEDLKELDLDLNDLDFDEYGKLDFKFLDPEQQSEREEIEDDIPDVDEKDCVISNGMLIELGDHKLLCGDCTIKENVELLMNGEKADMVFTDPPYDFESKGGGILSTRARKQMDEVRKNKVDKFDPECLFPLAKIHIYFHNKSLIKKYIYLSEKWNMSYDLAVYKKENPIPNYSGHLMTDLEYIAMIGDLDPNKGLERDFYSKLHCDKKDIDNKLSYSKPVELCEKFIKLYSDKTVLDLFLGSGSTLIACEKTNRKCYGMELDPHYCQVIIERWQKYSNKKAYIINDSKRIAYDEL